MSEVENAGADRQHALWKRLADERVAVLTTQDADGLPLGRPVMPR
jgi:hypothetical protein